MIIEKPNYYAIIPANVRYDSELRANEKLLFGEITALTDKYGECWANNKYFSELYNVKPNAIATWIRHLKEKGLISIEYEYNGKEITKRIIKIGDIQKDSRGGIQKHIKSGIQKGEENNTRYINNTSIICGSCQDTINKVIDYMNNVADEKYFKIKKYFKFKPTSNATIKIIKARLNEGWTKEDLYDVIYLAYYKFVEHEFKGNNNNSSINYFNPSTIFTSEKVQKYKNEYENLC